jgi:DNA-binding MarR family transcriptional regulator
MNKSTDGYFENCLYFTVSALQREIAQMADRAFAKIGMSASHAFLMILVIEKPGISQKELAESLHLASSTVSRFVDSLVVRGLLEKTHEGKIAHVSPTPQGKAILDSIHASWKELYLAYSDRLGKSDAVAVTKATYSAVSKLQGN